MVWGHVLEVESNQGRYRMKEAGFGHAALELVFDLIGKAFSDCITVRLPALSVSLSLLILFSLKSQLSRSQVMGPLMAAKLLCKTPPVTALRAYHHAISILLSYLFHHLLPLLLILHEIGHCTAFGLCSTHHMTPNQFVGVC